MQFGDWEEGHKMTEGFATMRADLIEKTSGDLLYGVKCGCLFRYRGTKQHQSPQPEPGATPMAATFFFFHFQNARQALSIWIIATLVFLLI